MYTVSIHILMYVCVYTHVHVRIGTTVCVYTCSFNVRIEVSKVFTLTVIRLINTINCLNL